MALPPHLASNNRLEQLFHRTHVVQLITAIIQSSGSCRLPPTGCLQDHRYSWLPAASHLSISLYESVQVGRGRLPHHRADAWRCSVHKGSRSLFLSIVMHAATEQCGVHSVSPFVCLALLTMTLLVTFPGWAGQLPYQLPYHCAGAQQCSVYMGPKSLFRALFFTLQLNDVQCTASHLSSVLHSSPCPHSSPFQVGPGGYHTIALTHSGAVYSWGHNRVGQLGYSNTDIDPKNIEGAFFQPLPQVRKVNFPLQGCVLFDTAMLQIAWHLMSLHSLQ